MAGVGRIEITMSDSLTIYGIIIALFLFLMLFYFGVLMVKDVKEKPGQGAPKG